MKMSVSPRVLAGDAVAAKLASPKRSGKADELFPYYAGYSVEFVQDALRELRLRPKSLILDPWNGAATTTVAAGAVGHRGIGFDLNPALVLVAKARCSRTPSARQVATLRRDIDENLPRFSWSRYDSEDPLSWWLEPKGVFYFRSLERLLRLRTGRGSHRQIPRLYGRTTLENVGPLAATAYVALFRTLRSFLTPFRTTNPTWFKTARGAPEDRVEVRRATLWHRFTAELDAVRDRLSKRAIKNVGPKLLEVGDSRRLPLRRSSVDAVVTSPPYCTRLDYAVATLPELAVLGCTGRELEALRRRLLGSPLTPGVDTFPAKRWGSTCRSFLRSVTRHQSKASDTYYSRFYTNYFSALADSLAEISRVVKRKARIVIVVQDSYYKGVHADLPKIVAEMGRELNWRETGRHDFVVNGTLAGIHPSAGRYRGDATATEAVLVMESA